MTYPWATIAGLLFVSFMSRLRILSLQTDVRKLTVRVYALEERLDLADCHKARP